MKLLLYCTKAKPYITQGTNGSVYPSCVISNGIQEWHLNGKIVAECDYEVEEIEYSLIVANNRPYHYYEPQNTFVDKFYEKSCLNHQQVEEYLGYKNGYAIHIKNLHIFDEPIKLEKCCNDKFEIINYAPQNMMYCYDKNTGEKYVLISIRPEWLVRILNHEKTIEVRKKVLKEMLKND